MGQSSPGDAALLGTGALSGGNVSGWMIYALRKRAIGSCTRGSGESLSCKGLILPSQFRMRATPDGRSRMMTPVDEGLWRPRRIGFAQQSC